MRLPLLSCLARSLGPLCCVVTESLFLLDHGHSAYEGDVFHQPPLLLLLFYPLRNLPLWATQLLFAGLDCIVAFALR